MCPRVPLVCPLLGECTGNYGEPQAVESVDQERKVSQVSGETGSHLCNLTWLKLVRTAVVDAGEGIAEVVG